jgi:predicted RNA-binding protein YlqC (UPF0109 family)
VQEDANPAAPGREAEEAAGGHSEAPASPTSVRDLVEFLCRALAAEPEAVQVEEVDEGGNVVLEVSVEGEDLGRLIGRGGRVANAIRTVAKAAARSSGEGRVLVEFVED